MKNKESSHLSRTLLTASSITVSYVLSLRAPGDEDHIIFERAVVCVTMSLQVFLTKKTKWQEELHNK